jgi:hypothetical protein
MEVDGKVQKRSRATQQVLERFYNNPPHLHELSID